MLTAQQGWFKPSDEEKVLFKKYGTLGVLRIRSLQLETDLDILFDWVNHDYSRQFWQMSGSKQVLRNTYSDLLKNPAAHPFFILLGEQPVALIDLYLVMADELQEHIEADESNCGLHLLMLPPKESKKDLSLYVLKGFLEYYFSFRQAGILYAEPDQENEKANLLAKKVGFEFLKTIQLSYKKANLYCFRRETL